MSRDHRGSKNPMYGKTHSPEARGKISIGNKGKEISPEVRQKISNGLKGEKNHNYGKKFSKEYRNKISVNHADMSGENNPSYKDGRCKTKEYELYRAAQKRAKKLNLTIKIFKKGDGLL